MRKTLIPIFIVLLLAGCSPAFWGGTGTGVVGAGAGYELNARHQITKLDEELKDGKITQQEHDIRVDQVKRDSLLQR